MMPRVSEEYLEKRKQLIVNSAALVFSKKGFTEATMKDVMTEAGISRGGLYAHFENIDALFLEVLKMDDEKDKQSLLKIGENPSVLKGIELWVRELFEEMNLPDRDLIRARSEYFLKYTEKEVPYLAERRNGLEQMLLTVLTKGVEEKELADTIELPIFVSVFISSIDGLMLSLNEYRRLSTNDEKQKKVTMLIEMLQQYLV